MGRGLCRGAAVAHRAELPGAAGLTAAWALIELIRRDARTVPHGPAMSVATAGAAALGII